MKRIELTKSHLTELGLPYNKHCLGRIVKAWEEDHAEQLEEETGFEIDAEDVRAYWMSYAVDLLSKEREEAHMVISKAEEVPKQSQWSYPPEEISYLLEQIEEGDRENGCEFLYYQGRLYEKEETKEW